LFGWVLPSGAQKIGTAVLDLAGNETAAEGSTGGGIVGIAELLSTQQHVTGNGAVHARQQPASFGKKSHTDARFGAKLHGTRRDHDIAE